MGAEQSITEQHQQQAFIDNHRKIKTYDDERYGKITLYVDKKEESKIYLVKEFWTASKKEEDTKMDALKLLASLKSPHLASIMAHFGKRELQFCNDFSKHILIYRFQGKTIKGEIEAWKVRRSSQSSQHFMPEEEVWYTINSVLLGLNKLASIGSYHGDIQPKTVHLS